MNKQTRQKIQKHASALQANQSASRIKRTALSQPPGDLPPDYARYIRSKAWQEKRREALSHYGHRCARCGRTADLQVHHLHYRTLGNEKMADLVVCCRGCHFKTHLPDPEENANWAGTYAQHPSESHKDET